MTRFGAFFAASCLATLFLANASQAQPYGWGPATPPAGYLEPPGMRDPREGKIQVQTFAANTPAAGALGHGPIVIAASPTSQLVGYEQGALKLPSPTNSPERGTRQVPVGRWSSSSSPMSLSSRLSGVVTR